MPLSFRSRYAPSLIAMTGLVLLLIACKQADPITASPAASSPTDHTTPVIPATQADDLTVSTHVQQAIKADPVLQNASVEVVTLKGDVRLIGTVGNQAQIDRAEKLARDEPGVHAIHNELMIKP